MGNKVSNVLGATTLIFSIAVAILLIPFLIPNETNKSHAVVVIGEGSSCNYSRAGIQNGLNCWCGEKTGCRYPLRCVNYVCKN